MTLQKETISPFARENDEEKGVAADAGSSGTKDAGKGGATVGKADAAGKGGTAEKKTEILTIDWDGMQNRIIDLPIKAGRIGNLTVGKDDALYYMTSGDDDDDNGSNTLHKYDLSKRKDQEVLDLTNYWLSADGKKMLYLKSGAWWVVDAGGKPDPAKGPVPVNDIQVKVDPAAEWANILDEAWRVNRDYFYDPNMHGVDWLAIKKKYAAFLPDLACRNDLNYLLQWMGSELSIGHHFITGGGDFPFETKTIMGGLLGADFETANGRYRLKKIYGGLNWNPNLRSPLTEPGV